MSEEREEKIHVEEEATDEGQQQSWTEEFVVTGEELVNTVKQLVHEAGVRRIVVKNEAQRINLEIPLVLGVAGIALLPVYSALALIAALVADCTITVERVEKEPESETAA
ncbi:MAG TPA: DUF4342 domain-containing protein [Anaerolineae bacterium]